VCFCNVIFAVGLCALAAAAAVVRVLVPPSFTAEVFEDEQAGCASRSGTKGTVSDA